ncbi:MAG: excinuclease ABC subunit UvrC [Armatimonadota bacterium]|nr:excinuclease ABC subunit UvrC [bacterium]MDW8320694.1 excinuclease ABC subunit UvrC [Armatimonadota bacterium]
MNDTLGEKLQTLPNLPGVYLFKDAQGTVLYVGKAVSLRPRVRSYFHKSAEHSIKTRRLVEKIDDVEWIVTDTELEALVLECNLIKRYRPPYNIRLRDDKQYPFLCLTTSEPFPRLVLTRRAKNDGNRYFGPYSGSRPVYQTIHLLNRLFPLVTCGEAFTGEPVRKPCLYYHLGRCPAPCAGLADKERYRETVREVEMFLNGKHEKLLKELHRRMEEAAEHLEFERAASLRDQIRAVEQVMSQQKVVSTDMVDQDVLAYAADEQRALVQMFFIRGGKLIGQQHFFLDGASGEDQRAALQEFLKQYYDQAQDVPGEILLPAPVEEAQIIEQWLRQKKGKRVQLVAPQRGSKKKLLEMALTNADLALEQARQQWLQKKAQQDAVLLALQDALGLETPPRRIEAYDISNLQGAAPVGVMVVLKEGKPSKRDYRRFGIKYLPETPNDFAMMREVVTRRLQEAKKGNPKFTELPHLMLIDGGKGQLNAALEAMREAGLQVPAIGLAKRFEEIYLPGRSEPLILPKDSPALHLLQAVRDEAHRFAVEYHRKVRIKRGTSSVLDEIPGVGPKRKQALLKHFGSVKRLKEASVEDIAAVPSISLSLAQTIYTELHKEEQAWSG